jgi:tellurite resistance-related uncharacterized protein
MSTANHKWLTLTAGFLIFSSLTACRVIVREENEGSKKQVDIRTPLGSVAVHTDTEQVPDTGLPVYPGARRVRDDDGSGSADVNVGIGSFGVKVLAAKFESDDAPETIASFYKDKMGTYGTVTECRGEIDFKGRLGSQQAVCRERRSARDIQLVVGTEERHRLVVVKPRRNVSEFAIVFIETRG